MTYQKASRKNYLLRLLIVSISVIAFTGCSNNQGGLEATTPSTAAPKVFISAETLLVVVCEELPEKLDRMNWVCGYKPNNQTRQLNLFVAESEIGFLYEKNQQIANFSMVDPKVGAWLAETTICGQGWIIKAYGKLYTTTFAEQTYAKLNAAKIPATKCQ